MPYEQYSRLACQAADCEDLDSACRLIQEALGQDDGGVAGIVFSDIDREDWEFLSRQEKEKRMEEYALVEFQHQTEISLAEFDVILTHGVDK